MILDNIPISDKPRVVIIGAGFGGIQVARELRNAPVQIVLIDRNNYHTFQPLLYQVATGGLEPGSIIYPIRRMFQSQRNIIFRMAEVRSIDKEKKEVVTNTGTIKFDYLVIASGSRSNFYGLENIRKNGISMKDIPQALRMKSMILQNLEKAVQIEDKDLREQLMSFVIVGGGPTGVELAGALAELRNNVFKYVYPEFSLKAMRIDLVEAGPRLLPAMTVQSSENALKFLERMDVNVWLNLKVKDHNEHKVFFEDDSYIATENIIWTAGVKGAAVKGLGKALLTPQNRIRVNEYCQLEDSPYIFAIGDVAANITADQKNGMPMIAPIAIQQGKLTGRNIQAMLKNSSLAPFSYHDKGTMATIGKNKAVAEIAGMRFSGYFAWCIWMLIHLLSLVGFRNKSLVLLDWVWNYFSYGYSMRFIIDPSKARKQKAVDETIHQYSYESAI